MKNVWLLFFLIPTLIAACTETDHDPDIVANVEGYRISFSELQSFHSDNFFEQLYPASDLRGFDNALEEMILNRLKVADFFNRELDQNDELMQPVRRVISEELVYRYYQDQYLGKHLNEQAIKAYHDGMDRIIRYRQIVLSKPDEPEPDTRHQMDEKINEIVASAEKGEDFGALVQRYSEHTPSKQNDGFVAPVSWEPEGSRAMFNQLYMLDPGELKVLETAQAYYIIKISDIERTDLAPLSQLRDKIKTELEKLYAPQSLQQFNRDRQKLVNPDSFEWNREGLLQLTEWAENRNFYPGYYEEIIERDLSEGNNFKILKYDNGEVDLQEYLRLLNTILIPRDAHHFTTEDFREFIEEAVRTDLIVQKAKELGLEKQLLQPDTESTGLRNRFVWLYDNKMVEQKIPEPAEENLRAFYDTNRESLFYQLAKVNLFVKLFDNFENALEMLEQIQHGKSFHTAADQRYYVMTYIRNRDGQVEPLHNSDLPFLAEVSFELEEGETAGPVEITDAENNTQYAVIKSAVRVPEKQIEYSEADNIEQQFRSYHRSRLQDQVKNDLYDRYKFIIYEESLKQHLAEIR